MINTLKKINNALRILFIGFTVIFALTKIFNVNPKKNVVTGENNAEYVTSEFDEIW